MELDESTLSTLKNQFAPRDIEVVTMVDGDIEIQFAMTPLNRQEWKKYRMDVTGSKDNLEKVETAIENTALAMIRWPDRQEVIKIFDRRPGMIQNFAAELGRMAGANAEARIKK